MQNSNVLSLTLLYIFLFAERYGAHKRGACLLDQCLVKHPLWSGFAVGIRESMRGWMMSWGRKGRNFPPKKYLLCFVRNRRLGGAVDESHLAPINPKIDERSCNPLKQFPITDILNNSTKLIYWTISHNGYIEGQRMVWQLPLWWLSAMISATLPAGENS